MPASNPNAPKSPAISKDQLKSSPWLDGKKIYTKTIQSTINLFASGNVRHNITNIGVYRTLPKTARHHDPLNFRITLVPIPPFVRSKDRLLFDYTNPANWELKAWLEPNPSGPHLCERTFRHTIVYKLCNV